MQVKIRTSHNNSIVRFATSGDIKEIMINENIANPDRESISLCFRGDNSSGIIDLTPEEIAKLIETIKDRIPQIKGFNSLSLRGAKLF